jgi:threonine dehydrogenase-like Zn-dependent dehydrogenase
LDFFEMKGKAAVFTGVGKPLEIREYPVPTPDPNSLVLKITMANICGSDLHFLKGLGPGVPSGIPQILGHEMTGRIYALGENVKTDSLGEPVKVGDRVVYAYFRPCGKCWACLTGQPGCPNRYKHWLGVSCEEPPHFVGAFGEYYYMRPGQVFFKVPDELPDEVVSPINCAFAQLVYGLYKIGVVLGDTVVVQGAGGLGLYATAIAKEMGAGQVIVIDKLKDRLELAREFGADHVINADETDSKSRVAEIKKLTRDIGADVVAELVGSPVVLEEGLEMLRPGGRYLWIGNINLGLKGEIDPAQAVRGAKTIMGVIVYEPWVIPRTLGFLKRTLHKYPYQKIISHKFKLTDINQAFEKAYQRQVIRVALVPD